MPLFSFSIHELCGLGNPKSGEIVTKGITRFEYGALHDIDGNGKLDIVFTSNDLLWISNPTSKQQAIDCNPLWTYHTRSKQYVMAPRIDCDRRWSHVALGDLDGDGQTDFVATLRPFGAQCTGAVYMGLRRGDHFELYKLIDNWGTPNQVELIDTNGDGRLDVVGTSDFGAQEVRFWRAPGYQV